MGLNTLWNSLSLYLCLTSSAGQFGLGVVAFFTFLRWVILLNCILSLIWLLFVVIPMAIHSDYGFMSQSFYIKNIMDGGVCLV